MNTILELFAGFLLAQVTLTLLLMAINRTGLKELKELTADWVTFMKRGIPIPSDHLKIEHPLRSQPTLIPLNFRYRKQPATLRSMKHD